MIKLAGTLTVNAIPGKRGVFHVGKLVSDIGEFAIRDKELDQFNPGSYDGEFLVQKISLASTRWKSGFFNDVQAIICKDGYLINEVDETPPVPESMTQPDPLEAESTSVPAPAPRPLQPASQAVALKAEPAPVSVDLTAADATLFGDELYAAFIKGEIVRLDTSVDRDLFRKQRDRLKNVGYKFDSIGQHWFLPAST